MTPTATSPDGSAAPSASDNRGDGDAPRTQAADDSEPTHERSVPASAFKARLARLEQSAPRDASDEGDRFWLEESLQDEQRADHPWSE